MDFKTWKNERAFSIGAELEVRIQNSASLKLEEISSKIIPHIPKSIKANIHQEFLECMLEFVSPVCTNSRDILKKIKKYLCIVNDIAKKHNAFLATSGSHSFKVDSLTPVKNKRYEKFSKEYGVLLQKFHICGFHIHIGMSSSDNALHVYNYMMDKLPIFLALSANSAFFDGQDTGLLSYRTQLFAQLPRAGTPSYFDNFEDMQKLYESLECSGAIKTSSDLWWDLRISPKFKTVEIRICDASSDFERLEDLINLYQALSFYALMQKTDRVPHQILTQNKWNASRYGLKGMYQNNSTCKSLKEFFLELIAELKNSKVFEKLGISTLHVKRLEERAYEKSLACKQQEVYKKTKSLHEIEKLGVFR